MNIVVDYNCGPEEAVRRMQSMAGEHDVELVPGANDREGTLAKKTGMGEARAKYRVGDTSIEIEIVKKPAFLPEGLVRREVSGLVERVLND